MTNVKQENVIALYDDEFIDALATESDAIEQSFLLRTPRNRSLRYCAEMMGMNAGHLSRVIQAHGGMAVNRAATYCQVVGNALWLQKVARSLGFVLVPENQYQQLLYEHERTGNRIPEMHWRASDFSTPR